MVQPLCISRLIELDNKPHIRRWITRFDDVLDIDRYVCQSGMQQMARDNPISRARHEDCQDWTSDPCVP